MKDKYIDLLRNYAVEYSNNLNNYSDLKKDLIKLYIKNLYKEIKTLEDLTGSDFNENRIKISN